MRSQLKAFIALMREEQFKRSSLLLCEKNSYKRRLFSNGLAWADMLFHFPWRLPPLIQLTVAKLTHRIQSYKTLEIHDLVKIQLSVRVRHKQ
jgi:hypothetical protein